MPGHKGPWPVCVPSDAGWSSKGAGMLPAPDQPIIVVGALYANFGVGGVVLQEKNSEHFPTRPS